MQNEKVTVQIAAKALGVTPKTIHQWLKVGTLTRVKEGNRTYILMDEIRALRQNKVITSKREVIGFDDDQTPGYNPGNNYLVIARDHYEGLLTRLGQLEAKQELLLEYKGSIEARDRTIADQRATIEAKEKELADLRAELERLRLPWYKRLWKRSKS